MKVVRIAVVGLGWVATHRHLPALLRDPRFQVVGVVDRDASLAAHWAARLRLPRQARAERIADIPWLDEVDAVDVVTSPMAHHALIRDALRCDKHVITEKPFAMTVAEGEELVALAAQRGLTLAIVHNFQFASSAGKLLRDLADGRIGTVRSIIATQWGNPGRRLPSWYEQLPAGLFFDESPHLLYLLRRLAPAPLKLRHVEAWASTLGHRTPACIEASFESRAAQGAVPVQLSCRFEAPLSEWYVSVLGDRAAGIVDVFRDIYLRLPNDGRHEAPQVLRTSLAATVAHWARHFVNGPLHVSGRLLYGNREVFARFGRAIAEGRPPEGIAADDALAVLRLQHDIIERAQGSIGRAADRPA